MPWGVDGRPLWGVDGRPLWGVGQLSAFPEVVVVCLSSHAYQLK